MLFHAELSCLAGAVAMRDKPFSLFHAEFRFEVVRVDIKLGVNLVVLRREEEAEKQLAVGKRLRVEDFSVENARKLGENELFRQFGISFVRIAAKRRSGFFARIIAKRRLGFFVRITEKFHAKRQH